MDLRLILAVVGLMSVELHSLRSIKASDNAWMHQKCRRPQLCAQHYAVHQTRAAPSVWLFGSVESRLTMSGSVRPSTRRATRK